MIGNKEIYDLLTEIRWDIAECKKLLRKLEQTKQKEE